LVHGVVEEDGEVGVGGGGKLLPDVFADEVVAVEQLDGAGVEEGVVPIAIEADDAVGGGFEDLIEAVGEGVAQGFGAFARAVVAIVEHQAVRNGQDRDVEPDVEGSVEVLDVAVRAGLHAAAVALFDLGADGLGEELPVGFAVEVLGLDAAEAARLFVCEEDAPIVVKDEYRIGEA
jgi:hypothetical protein